MRSIREVAKQHTKRLNEGFYSDVTEYEHPAIDRKTTALTPIPGTDRSPAIPNKTVQFCSMLNLLIRQKFALVTLPMVKGNMEQNFMVIRVWAVDIDTIDVLCWHKAEQICIRVRSWQRFNIFRGA